MSSTVAARGGDTVPQKTTTLSCSTIYLRVRLSLEEDPEPEINKDTLRQCLQGSLAQVFGKIGGAIPFEVLSLQQSNRVAFLKADKRDLIKLRAACTLISSCDGQTCHFKVEAVSPFLASLAQDSQAFAAQLPFPRA